MHFIEIIPFIKMLGLLGIFAIVFAESGLFFGFFFPGDSLLFTAGVLASAGYLNITLLFIGSFACAVLGDAVGYWSGRKLGPRIFSKPNSFFFNKKNLDKTADFYKKYGKKTVTLARFVPIVRTFAPILAGASNMLYKDFFVYNLMGGFFWVSIMVFTGYFLGNSISNIDQYILPITLVIIVISFIPVVLQFFSKKQQ